MAVEEDGSLGSLGSRWQFRQLADGSLGKLGCLGSRWFLQSKHILLSAVHRNARDTVLWPESMHHMLHFARYASLAALTVLRSA